MLYNLNFLRYKAKHKEQIVEVVKVANIQDIPKLPSVQDQDQDLAQKIKINLTNQHPNNK